MVEAVDSGRWQDWEGGRVWYRREGAGRPIAFLPNATVTWRLWEHQVEHFRASHDVVAVDLPGFGRFDRMHAPCPARARARPGELGAPRPEPPGEAVAGLLDLNSSMIRVTRSGRSQAPAWPHPSRTCVSAGPSAARTRSPASSGSSRFEPPHLAIARGLRRLDPDGEILWLAGDVARRLHAGVRGDAHVGHVAGGTLDDDGRASSRDLQSAPRHWAERTREEARS
jgi:hypothetical protein